MADESKVGSTVSVTRCWAEKLNRSNVRMNCSVRKLSLWRLLIKKTANVSNTNRTSKAHRPSHATPESGRKRNSLVDCQDQNFSQETTTYSSIKVMTINEIKITNERLLRLKFKLHCSSRRCILLGLKLMSQCSKNQLQS